MKKKMAFGGITLILLAICLAAFPMRRSLAAENEGRSFTIDVACDARTYVQNNVDPLASGSHRGDIFIVAGRIFPGGTIPAGNNVFTPDNPGSIGKWICRGVWMVSSDDLAAGASPAFDTTQIYLLPDGSRQLFSEGLEGPQPVFRTVTGGTGPLAGVRGQVRQELLGTNVTGLFNLRFIFELNGRAE